MCASTSIACIYMTVFVSSSTADMCQYRRVAVSVCTTRYRMGDGGRLRHGLFLCWIWGSGGLICHTRKRVNTIQLQTNKQLVSPLPAYRYLPEMRKSLQFVYLCSIIGTHINTHLPLGYVLMGYVFLAPKGQFQ